MLKHTIIILFALQLFWACTETSTTTCSLTREEFTKAISDSMIVLVESAGSPIEMKGKLKLDEGACTITLKAPTGDSILVYDSTFVNDTIFTIESINLTDTIFAIDSIFIADTIIKTNKLPEYKFIYNKSVEAPTTITLNEKYERKIGKWVFTYKIVKVDEVAPLGNFDFNISYND